MFLSFFAEGHDGGYRGVYLYRAHRFGDSCSINHNVKKNKLQAQVRSHDQPRVL